ncbi:MAG: Disulfide bond formation protein DsbA [Chloroflexi bacterium]|jgi:predicted DsbA family dithiol-disulfide isomerase|nr:Disulfide bond formation protein DsbA [Chloroflexota bacterium]
MKVEIFSDVACPWCYIGKRRFESALEQFAQKDQIEITWRSYQLDPSAPPISGISVNEILAKKYGMSPQQAAAANQQVSALASEEGLEYHLEKAQYGNTFDAHRLIQLAATRQLQDEVEERFFKAYFNEGAALGDRETLVQLVSEVGIDAEEARAVLAGNEFTNEVRSDIGRARELGIQGVPFFLFDEKYGVSGAQSAEVLKKALDRVWAESHPAPKFVTIGGDDGNSCEGDSCAIA